MHLVLTGKFNKVIADELNISMRTVEVHRSRVFEKMGCARRWNWLNCWRQGATDSGRRRPVRHHTRLAGRAAEGHVYAHPGDPRQASLHPQQWQ
jgi:hypothetical protein